MGCESLLGTPANVMTEYSAAELCLFSITSVLLDSELTGLMLPQISMHDSAVLAVKLLRLPDGGDLGSWGWFLLRYEPSMDWKHLFLAGLRGSKLDVGEEAHLWRRGSQWGRRMREQTAWTMNDLQTPGTTYRCEKYCFLSNHSVFVFSICLLPSLSFWPKCCPCWKVTEPCSSRKEGIYFLADTVPSILSAGFCQLVALSASHKLKTLEWIVVMSYK